MSRRSDEYQRGIPTKPYDLIREGLLALGFVAILIIVLAIVFKSPAAPTLRAEDVAKSDPLSYVKTVTNFLSGKSALQSYGPPYTPDQDNVQRVLGIAPANVLGVKHPLDARQDLVIAPLERVAMLNPVVAAAPQKWKAATADAQAGWTKVYGDALNKAEVSNGQVKVADGDYGPVPAMMNGMLELGRAGLLEGAVTHSDLLPYMLDTTKALLYFQEGPASDRAAKYDMQGTEWGITHEVGNLPGPWWLWPYAIWYQIPPLTTSPNPDAIVGSLMILFFLLLFFAPFIPVLKHLPRWIGIYRIIWRDWYARQEGAGKQPGKPAPKPRK